MSRPLQNPIPQHLVVYTHVSHHYNAEKIIAHEGFVREIDIWANIFRNVTVVAPFSTAPPQADAVAYLNSNIKYHRMGTTINSDGLWGKVTLLLSLVKWLYQGFQPIKADSVIMARGPSSAGMVGALLALILRRPHFAKYADQLGSYPSETIGVRIQRAFLKSNLFGGPVLVYGKHDATKPHLVPVNLPLSISPQEWEEAGRAIVRRPDPPPFQLLFVGRLSPSKGVDLLFHAIQTLYGEGFDLRLDVVGDGENRKNLEILSRQLGITDRINFYGWLSRQDVFNFYQNAFCLVNCSKRQGIDKVLIEAMTFALPVIGTEANIAQQILEPPRCGLTYAIDDLDGLLTQLRAILRNPSSGREMGKQGRQKTNDMQTDKLELMYRDFLREHLRMDC